MSEKAKKDGVIAVLAKRMVEERLPKAIELKERVDRGELLTDLDISFLDQVVADSAEIKPLIKDDARLTQIAARMLQLYKEVSLKALENEQSKRS